MATLLGGYGAKSSASRAKFGASVERPHFIFIKIFKIWHWNILIYIFNPKASPLDIVWSRKVTLLLSTWTQFEPAQSLATQSHGLLTWTAIVWTGRKWFDGWTLSEPIDHMLGRIDFGLEVFSFAAIYIYIYIYIYYPEQPCLQKVGSHNLRCIGCWVWNWGASVVITSIIQHLMIQHLEYMTHVLPVDQTL
jgi:hypothetical protein